MSDRNIDRRQAFAKIFQQYPLVLEQMTLNNTAMRNMAVADNDEKGKQPKTYEEIRAVMGVYMAQFMTRMLTTRCHKAGSSMEEFAKGVVKRYNDFRFGQIGAYELYSDTAHRTALEQYEQHNMGLVLAALIREAEIVNEAAAEGQDVSKFDEVDFWSDIFAGLCQNSRRSWPVWTQIAQIIFLDHRAEFKAALDLQ